MTIDRLDITEGLSAEEQVGPLEEPRAQDPVYGVDGLLVEPVGSC
jgi:hypothetical protein